MTTFTCPQRLFPPPSSVKCDQIQDPAVENGAVSAVAINRPTVETELLTDAHLVQERKEPTRLEPLDPDQHPWNS